MSEPRSCSSGASDQNYGGEELHNQPPKKQRKLDQCAQLPVIETSAESELVASRVTINDLPDEMMIRILSQMTCVELIKITQNVCEKWRLLAHDPKVWRGKKFCIDSSYSEDEAVAMLQQMSQLQTLEIESVVMPSVLDALADNCCSLTTLKIHSSQTLSYQFLEKLVEKCRNIQSLTIPHHKLCYEVPAMTVSRLNRLQSLVVKSRSTSGCVCLRDFADECRELVKLEVPYVFEKELKYFLGVKCKTVTDLTLPWATCPTCDLKSSVPLLSACTSLSSLQLYGYRMIREEVQESFTALGRMSNLRSLIISSIELQPPAAAKLAFESGGLSCLRELTLSIGNLQDDTVVAVCTHCPELKHLDLSGCHKLTDDSLQHVDRLSKLETLDLSECIHLDGEALASVARIATLRKLLLKRLNMEHLQPGLERLLDMTSLEILTLNLARNVSIFPFSRIPGQLVNLRILNLEQCRLDESVVKALQQQMPTLEVHFVRRDVEEDWEPDENGWVSDGTSWVSDKLYWSTADEYWYSD